MAKMAIDVAKNLRNGESIKNVISKKYGDIITSSLKITYNSIFCVIVVKQHF